MKLLVVVFLLSATMAQQSPSGKHQCRKKYEKVGCFHDRVIPDRPLTISLLNRIDKNSKKWDGEIIDWKHYEKTLYKLACKCAELTLARGYSYFGLQFFGECWSGPGNTTALYLRDGPSDECQGGKFEECDDKSSSECFGKCFSNYIYKVHKPRDGKWSSWSTWSKCSKTCGANSTRTRMRKCDNPAPAHGGRNCSTNSQLNVEKQSEVCQVPPCLEWSEWSTWASCTTSRNRVCRVAGTNKEAKGCPGQDEESQKCTQEQCDRPTWTQWTSWSVCSIPCGPKSGSHRSRKCMLRGKEILRIGFCKGEGIQHRPCTNCPQWGTWSTWSACAQTCGLSVTQSRSRQCLLNGKNRPTKDCPSNPPSGSFETRQCKLPGCPQWGSWSGWGPCSTTCGKSGTRSRKRSCFIEGTTTLTPGCSGPSGQSQACSLPGCPQWSTWSNWGPCSATCGLNNSRKRTRTRKCYHEGTTTLTSGCPGASLNTGNCPNIRCPCQCTEEDKKPKQLCAVFNAKIPMGSECEFIKFVCNRRDKDKISKVGWAACQRLNLPWL